MTDSKTYNVKIDGFGLSLEREVSKEIGDQVVVLILTGAQKAAPQVNVGQPPEKKPTVSRSSHVSIREFFNDVGAKRVPDKITAIGEYLRTHEDTQEFTSPDLVANFEAAADAVPKNLPRDIKWTLKAGWIAPRSGKKDTYYVTHSGQTAVGERFSKEVVKKTRGLLAGSAKKKGKKA